MKPPDAARPGRQPRSQDNPEHLHDSAAEPASQPLPVCACGRTLPRPRRCLWPAVVFCPCGAAHRFPRREASARQRELARARCHTINQRRKARPEPNQAEISRFGGGGAV